jgi:hypothetical protein
VCPGSSGRTGRIGGKTWVQRGVREGERKVGCLGSLSDVSEGRGKIWGRRGIKEVLGERAVFGFVVWVLVFCHCRHLADQRETLSVERRRGDERESRKSRVFKFIVCLGSWIRSRDSKESGESWADQ